MCTSVSRYDILVPHQGLDHYEKAIEEGRMTLDDVRLAIQVNRSRSSHETSLHYQPSALCASLSLSYQEDAHLAMHVTAKCAHFLKHCLSLVCVLSRILARDFFPSHALCALPHVATM